MAITRAELAEKEAKELRETLLFTALAFINLASEYTKREMPEYDFYGEGVSDDILKTFQNLRILYPKLRELPITAEARKFPAGNTPLIGDTKDVLGAPRMNREDKK